MLIHRCVIAWQNPNFLLWNHISRFLFCMIVKGKLSNKVWPILDTIIKIIKAQIFFTGSALILSISAYKHIILPSTLTFNYTVLTVQLQNKNNFFFSLLRFLICWQRLAAGIPCVVMHEMHVLHAWDAVSHAVKRVVCMPIMLV